MENQEQIEKEIEISIEHARQAVVKREMLISLFTDERFKVIFEEGYFKEEPARLTSLLSDPTWEGADKQEGLIRDLRSISGLRQYFLGINQMGIQMQNAIESSEDQLDAMRNPEEEEE